MDHPFAVGESEWGMIQPLQETIGQLLELNVRLPHDPGIPLLGVYPGETKAHAHAHTRAHTKPRGCIIHDGQNVGTTPASVTGEWRPVLFLCPFLRDVHDR